ARSTSEQKCRKSSSPAKSSSAGRSLHAFTVSLGPSRRNFHSMMAGSSSREEEPAIIEWKFRRDGPRLTVKACRDRPAEELFAGEDDFLHFCSEVDRALDAL